MRLAAAAVGLALVLAGCPIPQPLPDYPPGTITPPRILQATVYPQDPIIFVGAGCAYPEAEPSFELGAQLFDSNNVEQVVARWFVNYTADTPNELPILGDRPVPPNTDSTVFVRALAAQPFGAGYAFQPYQYPPPPGTGSTTGPPYNEAGTTRIVELLVSNNFMPEPASPPYREPATNFEVQLQRWVFVLVPGAVNCGPHPLPLR